MFNIAHAKSCVLRHIHNKVRAHLWNYSQTHICVHAHTQAMCAHDNLVAYASSPKYRKRGDIYQEYQDATRYCSVCKDVTEDEFHFILKSPLYNDLRKQYIKPYIWTKPSILNSSKYYVRNI
jgi:hypothetical protein